MGPKKNIYSYFCTPYEVLITVINSATEGHMKLAYYIPRSIVLHTLVVFDYVPGTLAPHFLTQGLRQ